MNVRIVEAFEVLIASYINSKTYNSSLYFFWTSINTSPFLTIINQASLGCMTGSLIFIPKKIVFITGRLHPAGMPFPEPSPARVVSSHVSLHPFTRICDFISVDNRPIHLAARHFRSAKIRNGYTV